MVYINAEGAIGRSKEQHILAKGVMGKALTSGKKGEMVLVELFPHYGDIPIFDRKTNDERKDKLLRSFANTVV